MICSPRHQWSCLNLKISSFVLLIYPWNRLRQLLASPGRVWLCSKCQVTVGTETGLGTFLSLSRVSCFPSVMFCGPWLPVDSSCLSPVTDPSHLHAIWFINKVFKPCLFIPPPSDSQFTLGGTGSVLFMCMAVNLSPLYWCDYHPLQFYFIELLTITYQ